MASAASAFTMIAMSEIAGLPARYKIESIIGEGGCGKVYRVFDSQLDRALALKIISRDSASIRASLVKEFRTLSKLHHPNLVRVFDFGSLDPRLFYFTMEYLEGADLRSYCRVAGNLAAIPLVVDQLLAALSYLHENGVVHGDIKPENISIAGNRDSPLAKLLDFGLISTSGSDDGGKIGGTPRFLAPEILQSGARKSPSTDLYALGASLSESIEDIDFPGATDLSDEILKRRYAGMSKSLAAAGVKNPSSVASFIIELCDPDHRERPAHAGTVRGSFMNKVFHSDIDNDGSLNPVFVGRNMEIDAVARFLQQKEQNEQRILVLKGPRGVGKKSIIRKAAQKEQIKRRLVVDLSSISVDYFSIKELLSIISGQLPGQARQILSARTTAKSPGADPIKEMTEAGILGQRSLVLMNHIIDWLHEISSRQPLALIVPDIDRLGPDHVKFLDQIMNYHDLVDFKMKTILSLNADVPLSDSTSPFIERLESSARAAFLDIDGFSDETLNIFLAAAFGRPLLSKNERSALLERANGIPLVIETIVRRLLSERIIRFENDAWVFDRSRFAQLDVPLESDAAFTTALSSLDEDAYCLLEYIAAYGRELPSIHSAGLVRHCGANWESSMRALLNAGIIRRDADGTISFVHPNLREHILHACSRRRLIFLNGTIADHLSRAEPNESYRIARHYLAAEDPDRALHYAQIVMDNLYSPFMPFDCLRLFADIGQLAKRSGTSAQIMQAAKLLAPIQHQTGLLNEAIESYLFLIKNEATSAERVQYWIQAALLYDNQGESDKAIAAMREAQRIVRAHNLTIWQAYVYYVLEDIMPKRTAYYLEKARESFKRQSNRDMYLMTLARLCQRHKTAGHIKESKRHEKALLRQLDASSDYAKKEIYRRLASVYLHSANYDAQRSCIEKKMAIESSQDDINGMIQSLISLAGNYYARGDCTALIETLKQTYSLAARHNHWRSAANAGYNLVLAYRQLGDYGKALNAKTKVETLMREKGIARTSSVSYVNPAQLHSLLGRTRQSEFLKSMDVLLISAKKAGNAISLGHYNMCYSTYHHINLRYKRALGFADKALAYFKKAEDRDDVVLALVQKGVLLVSLGDTKSAAPHVARATKIYDEIHCEYLKPFLMLGRGMLARCAGKEDARQMLAEGLRTSKKMGTRENTWQLQRELAIYHRDRGEYRKALDYFQDSIDTLKQITETLDEEELKLSYLEVPIRARIFEEIKDLRRRTR